MIRLSRCSFLAGALLLFSFAGAVRADDRAAPPAPAYPGTFRQDLVETRFGSPVADPYRWLEGDTEKEPAIAAWVAAQNQTTETYLAGLPGRAALRARMAALYDYERYGIPKKGGGRYFYTRNSGLLNQSPLFMRDGLEGTERLLLDPNLLSADGTRALAQWLPSDDGRYMLYAMQDAGSDQRSLWILNVESGKTLDDRIAGVSFTRLAWRHDGSGFFYSRFVRQAGKESLLDHRVYLHILGTAQAADRLIYATPRRPALMNVARITDDGRWLLILSSEGTDPRNEVTLIPITGKSMRPQRMVRGLSDDWAFAGSSGSLLFFRTDKDAARGRIVTLDAEHPQREPVEIVPERAEELIGASLVGERLVLAYLVGGRSVAIITALDGRRVGEVPMPGFGTAAGFDGRSGDSETFFRFSDFTTPNSIYRFDVRSGTLQAFAKPRLPFDPGDFVSEMRFFRSRDGTQVPIYLVRRKDVAAAGKPAPTLLYGYGGFNHALNPDFSPTRLAWIEQGGVLAVAGLRGGGEFGKAWHEAGRLGRKQNAFDDFIAAGEYLIAQSIAGPGQLAIEGRSNGGLLVGAVVNQRPDLFAAALPSVGVMDMLRFDRFTAGRFWIDDYGNPAREQDFRNLLAYSPYHNIHDGVDYPAILVTTAEEDDRVVPAHSFKYAAALQHADIGTKPHLLRVEPRAGHGTGTPIDKRIEEASDMYSFIAYWTGLRIEPK